MSCSVGWWQFSQLINCCLFIQLDYTAHVLSFVPESLINRTSIFSTPYVDGHIFWPLLELKPSQMCLTGFPGPLSRGWLVLVFVEGTQWVEWMWCKKSKRFGAFSIPALHLSITHRDRELGCRLPEEEKESKVGLPILSVLWCHTPALKSCLPCQDTMASISSMFHLAPYLELCLKPKEIISRPFWPLTFFLTSAITRYGLHRWPIPVSRECS